MPAALDLLSRGMGLIAQAFGEESFVIHEPLNKGGGLVGAYLGQWNDLGRSEEVTIGPRRVTFSVLVEARRSLFVSLPTEGQIVTRSSDNFRGRIVGEVQADELTVRFALDSVGPTKR